MTHGVYIYAKNVIISYRVESENVSIVEMTFKVTQGHR